MLNEREMEDVMNLTYPGLQLLSRDTNFSRFLEKYRPGTLLADERPVLGSFLGGGLAGRCRYAILSNRIEPAEWPASFAAGLAPSGHYKVLDVYRRLGKVQITLLHLPDGHWRFFEDVSTNVDDLLIEYTRKRFDSCLEAEPAEPLLDAHWRKTCANLIGMTDLGGMFPIE